MNILEIVVEIFKGIFSIFYNGLISWKVFFLNLDYLKIIQVIFAFVSAFYLYKKEVSRKVLKNKKAERVNL